ncbi:hypothetical protein VA7868_01691 [Vibrio aerogenes CECT 7868]|uniref:Uncharacterized protein n=1 Tax=Vibrio aerogenes CECT 7868 TaxID=1216006 RepID=A0A1M5YFA8_9VIBR|nr:hypothetical protein VA7868_01691 [Vibrio aerogenes CECT 7868]
MPATIAYDPSLSQKAREYLIQLEDYLNEMNQKSPDVREVLLQSHLVLWLFSSTISGSPAALIPVIISHRTGYIMFPYNFFVAECNDFVHFSEILLNTVG